MCGRYALFGPFSRRDPAWVAPWLEQLVATTGGEARYNVAPSQSVPAWVAPERDGAAAVVMLRWGLIPAWARDPKIAYSTINARAESLADKPAFRGAWRAGRRCLVPASGWYEWQALGTGKQAWFIDAGEGENPLAFAGLWERWRGPDGFEVDSCCIVTVDADPRIAHLHARQPLVLHAAHWPDWLRAGPGATALLGARAALRYVCHPVSNAVNDARNEGPRLLEPLAGR